MQGNVTCSPTSAHVHRQTHTFICQALTPDMTVLKDWAFKELNKVNGCHLGGTLIQQVGVLRRGRKTKDGHMQKEVVCKPRRVAAGERTPAHTLKPARRPPQL